MLEIQAEGGDNVELWGRKAGKAVKVSRERKGHQRLVIKTRNAGIEGGKWCTESGSIYTDATYAFSGSLDYRGCRPHHCC